MGFEIVLFYWLGALIILLAQVMSLCAFIFVIGILIYGSWERWLKRTPRAMKVLYIVMAEKYGLKEVRKNFKINEKWYKIIEVENE